MSNALPARDQSMDEILASIRRIIETGDERLARQASTLDALAKGTGDLQPLDEGSSRTLPQMASQADEVANARLRAEKLATVTDFEADETPEPASQVSEAARVSANAPRSIRRPAPESAEALPEWPQAVAANDRYVEVAADMFVDEFDEEGFADELLLGAIAGDVEAAPEAEPADPEVETASEDREVTPQARFDVLSAAFDQEPDDKPVAGPLDEGMRVAHALISQEAGERVAASFSDLASAIRDEHLSDVDAIVREVMRPMLQEWLDENLPRLVESLVREEIERIARGSKR
ncbi:DUF2497 domain-containing protein [Jiella sp. KSK16Y-1]|uniref:DUF2497 domain-containing protein n=1 Tax=Jiella mangrovi TaxID=2821407 RepID=A0ABS4BBG5_9HYPH|nr:DUF2497 domain-containing protein [Jiella mangrovi]MBP0614093.1 DUF2497 domain-containing protein [Jiella mangrovi]